MAWHSHLNLVFDDVHQQTRLQHYAHTGALRLQRALYPEPAPQQGICHAIMLYPPAGIASGDVLQIELDLTQRSHVVLTTPGANKWYGQDQLSVEQAYPISVQHPFTAQQHSRIVLGESARLEWLPQENIIYNQSIVYASNQFFLHPTASMMAWEINVLGRQLCGEQFLQGQLRLSNLFWQNSEDKSRLIVSDCVSQQAGSAWFSSPLGLANQPIFANFWCIPADAQRGQLSLWHQQVNQLIEQQQLPVLCSITASALVVRYVGHDVRQCFDALNRIRLSLREWMWQIQGYTPRIWAT